MKPVSDAVLAFCALIILFSFSVLFADSKTEAPTENNSVILKPYMTKKTEGRTAFLLVPDLFENRNVFDCTKNGLALFLQKKGNPTFSLNWPGDGKSGVGPDFEVLIDHVTKSIRTVQSLYKPKSIIVVGHGIGGLAALVASTNKDGPFPAAIVCIGTPGRLFIGNKVFDYLVEKEKSFESMLPIPTAKGATAKAPFPGSTAMILDILLTNDKNFDPDTRRAYYDKALEPVARPLARQMIRCLQTRSMQMTQNGPDYQKILSDVSCPALFIAGKTDNLVDPAETINAYNKIGSNIKGFRLFSTPNNYKTDYGHTGLLLAPGAHREVFPYLLKWLKGHKVLLR